MPPPRHDCRRTPRPRPPWAHRASAGWRRRAARLEAAGMLQQLELESDRRAAEAKIAGRSRYYRRLAHVRGDHGMNLVDLHPIDVRHAGNASTIRSGLTIDR